jgi:asparagine synthase (glutamine-hydrolysing)
VLEAIGKPLVDRYLGWICALDEPLRGALYSPELIAAIAAAEPGMVDPATVLESALAAAQRRDPVTRAMVADLLTYLPCDLLVKVDMASMAHSLECRGPFLDHRVVELALAIPIERKLRLRGGRSKVVLKQAFSELLPPAIRYRSKMGFGVPLDRWFRGELKNEVRAVLLDPCALGRGLFQPETVAMLVQEHVDGRRDHTQQLWTLLMLELWFRSHIDPGPVRTVLPCPAQMKK